MAAPESRDPPSSGSNSAENGKYTPTATPLKGVSHLTFIVRDLQRMSALLCQGLGAQEVYDSQGNDHSLSREKFFLLGGVWIAAMEGEPPAQRSYQHVAFAVDEVALPAYRRQLETMGVEFLPPRSRIEGEGQSLYFHDFDNHLFELHTGTLEQRLRRYLADTGGMLETRYPPNPETLP